MVVVGHTVLAMMTNVVVGCSESRACPYMVSTYLVTVCYLDRNLF